MATVFHQIPEAPVKVEGVQLFLDLDLGVLGWPPDEYMDYAQRIRYEYKHMSNEHFIIGRIKVLKHLLQGHKNSGIYYTDYFKEKYEVIAISNIDRELALLYEL